MRDFGGAYPGLWTVKLTMTDLEGSESVYSTSLLQQLELPFEFEVVGPPFPIPISGSAPAGKLVRSIIP